MSLHLRIDVSPERVEVLEREIAAGSEPHFPFYLMTAVSTAIAAFGLAMNSTAVVIGAMLVAPLMTPIFGLALALVQGDARLLGRAAKALIAGMLLAITVGAVLGYLLPGLEATSEMLARTRPNLFDLAVALLAGLAGAYALVDEKLSPSLPGVAIAVAIVPPLANTGLSLSLGSYAGAWGSFLLFFANFLSILLVASAVFTTARLVPNREALTAREITRRFGLASAGFLLVAIFLGSALVEMVGDRRINLTIHSVLRRELGALQATQLERLSYRRNGDTLYVLAHIYSPRVISPLRVGRLEETLETELARPTELFVRSTLSRDVSATGHMNQVATQDLDGFFYAGQPDESVKLARQAEQIIRERLSDQVWISLDQVTATIWQGKGLIFAWVSGIRKLSGGEIDQIEGEIREAAGMDIFLGLVHEQSDVYDRYGSYKFGWFLPFGMAEDPGFVLINSTLRELLSGRGYSVDGLSATVHAGVYQVLVEVAGPDRISEEDVAELKATVQPKLEHPLELYVRWRPEVVLTPEGPLAFDVLSERIRSQFRGDYPAEVKLMLEQSQ